MPEEGLEPTLLAEPDPKSGASANFAIRAMRAVRWSLRSATFRPEKGSRKRKVSSIISLRPCRHPSRPSDQSGTRKGGNADLARVDHSHHHFHGGFADDVVVEG